MKKIIIIFVFLSVMASAMNYIAYPLFGRILSPSEYVSITIALSLFTQMSTFLSSITAITIGLSKSDPDNNTNDKIELLQASLFKLFLVLSVVFLLVSPIIMSKVNAPTLFAIPISLMMLFSIPIQVISGYFNGKNQMIKLGFVALISASSQFIIGITTSLISHNGLITMFSMTAAQVITLIIIYIVFSKSKLPAIFKSLTTPMHAIKENHMGALVTYTLLASIAIMVISLVQIADLFIIQSLNQNDARFYTDIYVISRIVFFAGMIFIWPFLGEISLHHHRLNHKPFLKLLGYFTLITLGAIIALYFFGDKFTSILFGSNYSLQQVRIVGVMSVLYKYLLLIITAVILYFVVMRRYIIVWISLSICIAIFIFSRFISSSSNITNIITGLDIIAGIVAGTSVVLLLYIPVRKMDSI